MGYLNENDFENMRIEKLGEEIVVHLYDGAVDKCMFYGAISMDFGIIFSFRSCLLIVQ